MLQQHKILQRLMKNRIFVKAEKCEFHVTSIAFLGYTLEEGKVRACPVKIQTIKDWLPPETWKQLQHFIGFCKVLQKIYSQIHQDRRAIQFPHVNLKTIAVDPRG